MESSFYRTQDMSSYHQFMVRKMHAIKKRKEKKAESRLIRALPALAQFPTGVFHNLADIQDAYKRAQHV